MSVHVAGVRSNILKSNFSENNFSFTPILSCEWNWSEEQIEKRWKISQSIASTCLMKKISQSTDLHILSGVQFKCPPGHTFAPRKASPKSSSPICGQVVAPSPPLLASPTYLIFVIFFTRAKFWFGFLFWSWKRPPMVILDAKNRFLTPKSKNGDHVLPPTFPKHGVMSMPLLAAAVLNGIVGP